eukprot:TRINITY_DN3563_c0_g1_i4.p2 TRINITY_DN3563_c0_g1~~TRINITY_DN3563_c0_g1_i4.p2  ORF type:complete len:100 (+),score=7.66 TRINITY_DN3563_c0_g1_i4:357-656(+)
MYSANGNATASFRFQKESKDVVVDSKHSRTVGGNRTQNMLFVSPQPGCFPCGGLSELKMCSGSNDRTLAPVAYDSYSIQRKVIQKPATLHAMIVVVSIW